MAELHPNRIPGSEDAVVEDEKIRDFLLNREHPENRGRAAFFALFGYEQERWRDLSDHFRTQLPLVAGRKRLETAWGGQWEALIEITGGGRHARVITGWEVGREKPPRLITAYPARNGQR